MGVRSGPHDGIQYGNPSVGSLGPAVQDEEPQGQREQQGGAGHAPVTLRGRLVGGRIGGDVLCLGHLQSKVESVLPVDTESFTMQDGRAQLSNPNSLKRTLLYRTTRLCRL